MSQDDVQLVKRRFSIRALCNLCMLSAIIVWRPLYPPIFSDAVGGAWPTSDVTKEKGVISVNRSHFGESLGVVRGLVGWSGKSRDLVIP